jgi:hypothetical protein
MVHFKCKVVSSYLLLSASSVLLGAANLREVTLPVPQTWDDAEMAAVELPLANPSATPKHAPSKYYYKIPVRPIYKQYPIYAPGHEPAGYMEWLKRQDPTILWDDQGRAPKLDTATNWIKAGELSFQAQIIGGDATQIPVEDVRDPRWYELGGVPVSKDGKLPFLNYVIREKGKVEVGAFACSMCHTRVLQDGAVIAGAQGNFPFERAMAHLSSPPTPPQVSYMARRLLWAAPWVQPDPIEQLDRLSTSELTHMKETVPPGVLTRHRSNPWCPPHIPDLFGLKHRHYLDATGLHQHRSIVDLMRYAALNQGGDFLSSFNGFIPADIPHFNSLPRLPDKRGAITRYSDEQLYALALYVYSLTPPPSSRKLTALAVRGQHVFQRSGCNECHTPPFYTNNKLTLADGFPLQSGAAQRYAVMPLSVGTDPQLATKTRRGTGYYKVPSLIGVSNRSMFGHSGWCATLEDWFNPMRTQDDYQPTGFVPYGVKTYAVKGHLFGLTLSKSDRSALIAFLRTL